MDEAVKPRKSVEQALAECGAMYSTVEQIVHATGLPAADVTAELRALNAAGRLDPLPGGGQIAPKYRIKAATDAPTVAELERTIAGLREAVAVERAHRAELEAQNAELRDRAEAAERARREASTQANRPASEGIALQVKGFLVVTQGERLDIMKKCERATQRAQRLAAQMGEDVAVLAIAEVGKVVHAPTWVPKRVPA